MGTRHSLRAVPLVSGGDRLSVSERIPLCLVLIRPVGIASVNGFLTMRSPRTGTDILLKVLSIKGTFIKCFYNIKPS